MNTQAAPKRRRVGVRHSLAAIALFLAVVLPGCLTDGSIPVGGGGKATLRGVVVHAEHPDLPVPHARITLRAADGATRQVSGDNAGHWEVHDLSPGTYRVTFEGVGRLGEFLPVNVEVRADQASFTSIAVAVEPKRVDAPGVTAVEVSPRDATVAAGASLQFQAAVSGGNPWRKVPTWVAEGGVGLISPRGEFTAIQPGTGVIRAVIGDHEGATTVTVTGP